MSRSRGCTPLRLLLPLLAPLLSPEEEGERGGGRRRRWRPQLGLPLTYISSFAYLALVAAHPLCLNFDTPVTLGSVSSDLDRCSFLLDEEKYEGSCCDAKGDASANSLFVDLGGAAANSTCQDYLSQYTCGSCHPWSAHLFESFGDRMMLCREWCLDFVSACEGSLDFGEDFCEDNSLPEDDMYCYPYEAWKNEPTGSSNMLPAYENYAGGNILGVTLTFRPDIGYLWIVDQWGSVVEVLGKIGSAAGTRTVLDRGVVPSYPALGSDTELGEMGLLGLVHHPGFGRVNWFFYVYYVTDAPGYLASRLSRMTFDQATGKGGDEVVMATFKQPATNHNGGWLGFRPNVDRSAPQQTLFLSTGDGGGGNDNFNNSQNDDSPLGKILNFDVGTDGSFPSGDDGQAVYTVYAKGMRNPWKCAFRPEDGSLYCGDVGQEKVEWISRVPEGSNQGWPCWEGSLNNRGAIFYVSADDLCEGVPDHFPVFQYCHQSFAWSDECQGIDIQGQSITGGFFYNGEKYRDVIGGDYIFADYATTQLWGLHWGANATEEYYYISTLGSKPVAFGETPNGELVVYGYDDNVYEVPCGDRCSNPPELATRTFCGDGIISEEEECDDGIALNSNVKPNACRKDCTKPRCGDGVVDDERKEQCDGGRLCSKKCKLVPVCGDGIIQGTEECDGGPNCEKNCTIKVTQKAPIAETKKGGSRFL